MGWPAHVCCVKCIPLFVSVLDVGVNNPAGMQSMITINWPLLILADSPEFPRKLTITGMVKMCRNEDTLTSKRLMEIGETCIDGTCPIQIFSCHLFYLEVNLMPYGFLFTI